MNDPQTIDPRRRIRELLAIPDRDRTDEEWDELNELEIRTAPGNREVPERQQDKRYGTQGVNNGNNGRRHERNQERKNGGQRQGQDARGKDHATRGENKAQEPRNAQAEGRNEGRTPRRQHRRVKRQNDGQGSNAGGNAGTAQTSAVSGGGEAPVGDSGSAGGTSES